MALFFRYIVLPSVSRPNLQMVLHAHKHDFFLQLRQSCQFRWYTYSALPVKLYVLGLAIKEPTERPNILPRGRRLCETLAKVPKGFLRVKGERLVRSRGYKKAAARRTRQGLAEMGGNRDPQLFVQDTVKSSRKKHNLPTSHHNDPQPPKDSRFPAAVKRSFFVPYSGRKQGAILNLMTVENPNLITGEIDRYDYELPRHLIAQHPVASRIDARLLVVDRHKQTLEHHHIRDLPELLNPGDCLVLNDTQVVAARLLGRRESTGGHWEGLFLEVGQGGMWRILCKARGRLFAKEWIRLTNALGEEDIRLQLAVKQADGSWIALPESDEETFPLLERVGRVPLPPYIRKGEMEAADRQQYQTVYARWPGAVAAPTAGLHFSEPLLRRLEEDKIAICPLTLHTGAGTFRPLSAPRLAEHRMHRNGARSARKR